MTVSGGIMKKVFLAGLLAAGLLVGASKPGNAQNTPGFRSDNNSPSTADQGSSQVVVLAGCLERGPGAGEYSLFGQGLHWWQLKSDSVNLALFLNLEVEVSALKSPSDDGTFTVTDLTLVSTSCASR
jgi:hypothetical protein